MPAAQGANGEDRVPRLAPDCDPTSLDLTPAEGFLLSRIDGHTPCSVLRVLGGLEPEAVDACLERWIGEGVLVWGASGPPSARPKKQPKTVCETAPAAAESAPGLPALDPSLDIPVEAQQAILDMHARLDRPYPEILGVELEADVKTVKRAYFALSKEFHPDRYFRKEIGAYADLLQPVFRKIVEAYELLSNPMVRREIEKSLQADAPPPPAPATGEEAKPAASKARRRRPPAHPFSPFARFVAQRKAKAKTFFEAAMAAVADENWLEAAGSLRMAIAYDPHNATYQERFGEVQPKAHAIRFDQLIKEAEGALSFKDGREALKIYEEALHFAPWNGRANHTAARLAWMVAEDLRKAKDFAMAACEAEPDNAEFRKTLGMIYKAAGLTSNARRELKAALRLDPKDREAKSELRSL